MTDRIAGRVAVVTSDREVILNRGREHGVEVGMHFAIKGDPIEVIDPESDEPIGEVASVKVVVRVDEVDDKFCIARTFRTRRVKVKDEVKAGPLYGTIAGGRLDNFLQPPSPAEYETRVETLRVNPRGGASIAAEESVVQVGDVAELVIEGESINPTTTTLFR